jgi:aquaporin Z
MEGALLGTFMVAACAVTALVQHPSSPLHAAVPDALRRRALIGLAMGLTATALVYSPWGQQSGAHFNPAVTLTYLRLGKIAARDACGYLGGQCAGAIAGVLLAAVGFGMLAAHPSVHFAATVPGRGGAGGAFIAELAISFLLMSVVLELSNSRFARATGIACGGLVAAYITVEAPWSGMSMNPARSLASALFAGEWRSLWIYLTAPPLGMLAAAELFVRRRGAHGVRCAKLNHHGTRRCIFRCAVVAAPPAVAGRRQEASS